MTDLIWVQGYGFHTRNLGLLVRLLDVGFFASWGDVCWVPVERCWRLDKRGFEPMWLCFGGTPRWRSRGGGRMCENYELKQKTSQNGQKHSSFYITLTTLLIDYLVLELIGF